MNTKSPVVQAGPNLHTCDTISLSRTNLEILYTDWVRNMNIQGRSQNSLSSYNKIYIHGTDDKYKKLNLLKKDKIWLWDTIYTSSQCGGCMWMRPNIDAKHNWPCTC